MYLIGGLQFLGIIVGVMLVTVLIFAGPALFWRWAVGFRMVDFIWNDQDKVYKHVWIRKNPGWLIRFLDRLTPGWIKKISSFLYTWFERTMPKLFIILMGLLVVSILGFGSYGYSQQQVLISFSEECEYTCREDETSRLWEEDGDIKCACTPVGAEEVFILGHIPCG